MNAAVTDHDEPSTTGRRGGGGMQGRRILENLPSGARTTGEQAAARSRMVRRLRLALPILAVVLVAAFIFNTRSKSVDQAFLEEFKDISTSTEELEMANPRFAGVDDKGRPFEITANSAKQDPGRKNLVELDQPRATQGAEEERTLVTAHRGLYDSDENVLELSDTVTLQHEIGRDVYVLKSPSATVSIEDELVTSNSGVGGTGPDGGSLRADTMKAYNSEGRVLFEGNVSMRIYPKKNKENDGGDSAIPLLKDVEIAEPQ